MPMQWAAQLATRTGMTNDDASEALQIIDLNPEAKVEVDVDNLRRLGQSVQASGADRVCIVSVMGTYRTGKSFLLDLLMRHLNHRIKEETKYAPVVATNEPQLPSLGTNGEESELSKRKKERAKSHDAWYLGKPNAPLPEWLREAKDPDNLSEGSDNKTGFKWKSGKEKCTQGIWIWSKPWVFQRKNEKIGVLLMDTQGAWDDSMTKDQSATIFGLTALLSSKLIYNIQNRIEEDKLENLDYFTTFAHRACSDMSGENFPFGDLHLLIRDWVNFDDKWKLKQCKDQMNEHLEEFLDEEKVPEDSKGRVQRLHATFKSIRCFGLDHPGKAVTRPKFAGEIGMIEPDFLNLLDMFCSDIFDDDFPQPSRPLGNAISARGFVQVVLNFVEAFKNNSGMAIGLREAFVKIDIMKAKEDMMDAFKKMIEQLVPSTKIVDPNIVEAQVAHVKKMALEEYRKRLRVFRPTEETIEEYMKHFEVMLDQVAGPPLARNREIVEGATTKLVASPAVAFGVWFVAVHHVLLVAAGIGCVFLNMKKWVERERVDYCPPNPSVLSGMTEDARNFVLQRWRDLQAMWIQLHRITPADVQSTLVQSAAKIGAQALATTNNAMPVPQGGVTQPGAGTPSGKFSQDNR